MAKKNNKRNRNTLAEGDECILFIANKQVYTRYIGLVGFEDATKTKLGFYQPNIQWKATTT